MVYKNIPTHDLPNESWVPIIGYESLYMISNMGRVKSLAKTLPMPNSGSKYYPDIIMSPRCGNHGYFYVNLVRDKIRKTCTVHRLVAIHFIENASLLKIVDHLNGDKKDNRSCNLEWTTSAINNQRAYDLGLKKGPHTGKFGAESHSSKAVNQFTMQGDFVKRFAGQCEAMRETGIRQSAISAVINGRQNSAGGFIWKFA